MMKYRERLNGRHMTLNTSWFKRDNSLTFRSFSSKDYSKKKRKQQTQFDCICRGRNEAQRILSVNQILKFISTLIIATAHLSKLVLKHTLDLKHMDNNDTPHQRLIQIDGFLCLCLLSWVGRCSRRKVAK